MKKRKMKTHAPVRVRDIQVVARRARHRSRLLVDVWAYLGSYVGDRDADPERKLMIDGVAVDADPAMVDELRGEILIAATVMNRRRRELLEQDVPSAIGEPDEPIFEDRWWTS